MTSAPRAARIDDYEAAVTEAFRRVPPTVEVPRRYRFEGLLGRGGQGEVHKVRLILPQGFTREAAVKLLPTDVSPTVVAGFRDEARLLGLLRDRAVVTVEQPARIAGRWGLVMEYVAGETLGSVLKRGPLPPGVALELVGEIARALDHAWHQRALGGERLELVHRDLKPGNVMLTPFGEVKVLDFGLARARFATRELSAVRRGGTPGYMAPESRDGAAGPAGDIYALGVLLEQAICGRRRRDDQIPTPRHALPDNARDAIALAHQMRHLDPRLRPTAKAAHRHCRALRGRLSGAWLHDWAHEHVADSAAATTHLDGSVLTEHSSGDEPLAVEETPIEVTWRVDRRPWLLAVAAAVLLLALLAGTGAAGDDALPEPAPSMPYGIEID